MDATHGLRVEHRLIERVLEAFEVALRRPAPVVPGAFDGFVGFFQDFADGCHHGKEERGLFAHLEKQGACLDGTPVAQMVDEHAWNRELLGRFRACLDAGAGDAEAMRLLAERGRAYAEALRRHIDKEEHCVFGMAERRIRGPALEALRRVDRQIEAQPAHRAALARSLRRAERLLADHGIAPPPAQPARPAAAEGPDHPASSADAGWRAWATPLPPTPGSELAARVERAFGSLPVARLRALVERAGGRLDPRPILWKRLPGPSLRLFFPVHGPSDAIEEGQVVALVLLYDVAGERTLYAHPIHAGPGANPLLRHWTGPMADPKAQGGSNGGRATRRLLEHKNALWTRFRSECERMGPGEAGRRWRERYAWSLVRLYFCERCAACRWGSPAFDGAGGSEIFRSTEVADGVAARPAFSLPAGSDEIAAAIRASEAWQVEVGYARRGGFEIQGEPSLVLALEDDHALAVFASDAEHLDGGSIVGAAAWLHRPSGEVRHVHCLAAGPEAERVFLDGAPALGLPAPGAGRPGAPEAYVRWRGDAWLRFWLEELELGIHAASRRWLEGHRAALAALGGAPA